MACCESLYRAATSVAGRFTKAHILCHQLQLAGANCRPRPRQHHYKPDLINSLFAYVALSRASLQAKIYTNDSSGLSQKLAHDIAKTTAVEFSHSQAQAVADAAISQNSFDFAQVRSSRPSLRISNSNAVAVVGA
jgi:hypothetical protein